MAIFNNGNSTNKAYTTDTNTTIITAGAKIKGDINLTCKLYIDGEFEGVIHSDKGVTIGKNGYVKGDVFAKNITIQGKVEGSVDADLVNIKELGKIHGNVTSMELVVEAKGILEGKSTLKTTKAIEHKVHLNKS